MFKAKLSEPTHWGLLRYVSPYLNRPSVCPITSSLPGTLGLQCDESQEATMGKRGSPKVEKLTPITWVLPCPLIYPILGEKLRG